MMSAALYRFLLTPQLKYAAYEFLALFYRDRDWYAWRFPDRLIPLYFILRPLSYIWRSFLRLGGPQDAA
jgi:hypothetical protein